MNNKNKVVQVYASACTKDDDLEAIWFKTTELLSFIRQYTIAANIVVGSYQGTQELTIVAYVTEQDAELIMRQAVNGYKQDCVMLVDGDQAFTYNKTSKKPIGEVEIVTELTGQEYYTAIGDGKYLVSKV